MLPSSILGFSLEMLLLLASAGFIFCLKLLSSPKTARMGNLIGAGGMLLAIIVTFIRADPPHLTGLFVAILLGSAVGLVMGRYVVMTAMPQMVAILNGFGGAASVLVSTSEMTRYSLLPLVQPDLQFTLTGWFSLVVGAITITGSMVAFGKLQGWVTSRAVTFPGLKWLLSLLFIAVLSGAVLFVRDPDSMAIFWGVMAISAVLGVLLVIPIGGADMPVVISLLNSYSGIAALAAGFVVGSSILIISGSLVGASGIILTKLMCQAMNRSLFNVIFGAFTVTPAALQKGGEVKPMREYTPMDAAMLMADAREVIIITGYGLAVSQAQHSLRELGDELKSRGVTVKYAVHPVAGRMPGHMNVLLAEADVPYDELYDLEEVNGDFENADVALVIGANDVVNPSAREDKTSPLYGMPILNADKAKSVIVMKRGRGAGFAGVDNPLFTLDQTGLVFGDAKKSLNAVLGEVKGL